MKRSEGLPNQESVPKRRNAYERAPRHACYRRIQPGRSRGLQQAESRSGQQRAWYHRSQIGHSQHLPEARHRARLHLSVSGISLVPREKILEKGAHLLISHCVIRQHNEDSSGCLPNQESARKRRTVCEQAPRRVWCRRIPTGPRQGLPWAPRSAWCHRSQTGHSRHSREAHPRACLHLPISGNNISSRNIMLNQGECLLVRI